MCSIQYSQYGEHNTQLVYCAQVIIVLYGLNECAMAILYVLENQ